MGCKDRIITKTKKSKSIMEYLKKNEIVNLNIIGIIENESEAEIYVDNEDVPNGVLVRHGYFNYLYTEDDNFLDKVLEELFKDNFYGFSGLYRPIAEKIKRRYLVTWENRCSLYYLPKENLDLSLIKNPVRSIDIEDSETVDDFYTYRDSESIEKIKKDILYRPSSAVYVNGSIASWVLTHNDNSIGIMYTKKEYRKKGYAVDVTIDIASKIIKSGKIPFLQIVESNNMSTGLAAKCGFESHGYADWFGVIVGTPQPIIDINNKIKSNHLDTIEGFTYLKDEKLNCMYLAPHGFKEKYEEIQGFTLEKVTGSEGIDLWCEVLISSLNIDENEKSSFKNIVYKAVSKVENRYNLYIGILNGRPVSAIALLKYETDIIGLYFAAVIPEIRGRGVGRATIIEAIKIGIKNHDVEFVLLQSPERYGKIFEDIGFIHSHYI